MRYRDLLLTLKGKKGWLSGREGGGANFVLNASFVKNFDAELIDVGEDYVVFNMNKYPATGKRVLPIFALTIFDD